MNVTFSKNGPTGLSDDPYQIGTFSAWNTFAEKVNKGWYTLDGKCLQGKPTHKGIYIVKGRKVVIN